MTSYIGCTRYSCRIGGFLSRFPMSRKSRSELGPLTTLLVSLEHWREPGIFPHRSTFSLASLSSSSSIIPNRGSPVHGTQSLLGCRRHFCLQNRLYKPIISTLKPITSKQKFTTLTNITNYIKTFSEHNVQSRKRQRWPQG